MKILNFIFKKWVLIGLVTGAACHNSFATPYVKLKTLGGLVGNGGAVVVCLNVPEAAPKIEILDYYEGRELRKMDIDIEKIEGKYLEKVSAMISRIRPHSELRFELYSDWLEQFESKVMFLGNADFVTVPDTSHIAIPQGCRLEQAAIQRDPRFENDPRYFIKKEIWDALSESQKAGLVMHELIYREAISYGHDDSIGARYLNAVLSSPSSSHYDAKSFLKLLEMLHFEFQDFSFEGSRLFSNILTDRFGHPGESEPKRVFKVLKDRILVRIGTCSRPGCQNFSKSRDEGSLAIEWKQDAEKINVKELHGYMEFSKYVENERTKENIKTSPKEGLPILKPFEKNIGLKETDNLGIEWVSHLGIYHWALGLESFNEPKKYVDTPIAIDLFTNKEGKVLRFDVSRINNRSGVMTSVREGASIEVASATVSDINSALDFDILDISSFNYIPKGSQNIQRLSALCENHEFESFERNVNACLGENQTAIGRTNLKMELEMEVGSNGANKVKNAQIKLVDAHTQVSVFTSRKYLGLETLQSNFSMSAGQVLEIDTENYLPLNFSNIFYANLASSSFSCLQNGNSGISFVPTDDKAQLRELISRGICSFKSPAQVEAVSFSPEQVSLYPGTLMPKSLILPFGANLLKKGGGGIIVNAGETIYFTPDGYAQVSAPEN